MLKKINQTGCYWLWIAVLVFLVDRITKYCAQKWLVLYTPVAIFPFFNLTLAYNKGAAFSFLDSFSGWQVWLFGLISVVVSAGILIWLYRLPTHQRWLSVSLTLVLGGALGNFCDRVLYGHVIDFLDFYVGHLHWPAFNIADSAICVGAVMLVLDAMFYKKS